jgi:hypothetical protein
MQSCNGPSRAEPITLLYCLIRDSPNLQGQVPVFISLRKRVNQLYARALGSLYVVFYYSQGFDGGILSGLHTGWTYLLLRTEKGSETTLRNVNKLVSQELLWLRHGNSSGTQRKENGRRWKPVPEDWWRDNRDSLCAVVNCRAWIGGSSTVNCKCAINRVTNPNPTSITLFKRVRIDIGIWEDAGFRNSTEYGILTYVMWNQKGSWNIFIYISKKYHKYKSPWFRV